MDDNFSVVIPSPIAGIDPMSIEKKTKIPPHEVSRVIFLDQLMILFGKIYNR